MREILNTIVWGALPWAIIAFVLKRQELKQKSAELLMERKHHKQMTRYSQWLELHLEKMLPGEQAWIQTTSYDEWIEAHRDCHGVADLTTSEIPRLPNLLEEYEKALQVRSD